ncbi:hypothetical protein [Alloactinosynnema sp. L-07]|uniref:hypothetical protein n=1 Tax=Alloactinosynnema sp. L-07 TaxID=1653480 RepID=UPI00065F0892|nr:hypothetical protein [Alloactinosynnema sp. L-07]CRK55099.1 hypothetical protein [Alloactinosynnema sp. L-07]
MRDLTGDEEERLRQWWRQVFAACGYGLVVMGSFDHGVPLSSVDEQSEERIPAPTEK